MSAITILREGTPEYEAKLRGLVVQPDAARRILAEYIRGVGSKSGRDEGSNAGLAVGNRIMLVGDTYHFPLPRHGSLMPRRVYYVDGRTGQVEVRRDREPPAPREAKPVSSRARTTPGAIRQIVPAKARIVSRRGAEPQRGGLPG